MMSEEIRPLGSRILIRLLEGEAVTSTGLVIPDTAKEKPQRGTVEAIGDDLDMIKVGPGDVVLFAKYTGTEVRIDGVDHLILDAADVLAVVSPVGAASSR
jgi:chaperonin GroES